VDNNWMSETIQCHNKKNYENLVELNALALSIMILARKPNLVLILSSKNSFTTLFVAPFTGIGSNHLIK
jgi:hypothetical protein